MPQYNEVTRMFEFNDGVFSIICPTIGQLISSVRDLAGINILPYLN